MEEVWRELTGVSPQPTSAAAARAPLYWLSHQELTAAAPPDKTDQTPFLHYALKPTTTDCCGWSARKRSPPNYENEPDQKNKRLIKNRESAARSRARKQAYICELEAEVAHLMQENAKLRKQQEKACAAAVGHPRETKKKLSRTLTAPF